MAFQLKLRKSLIVLALLPAAVALAKEGDFNEKKFNETLATANKDKNSKTVIYSWSPQMVLSQKGLEEIIQWQKEMKFKLVVVLDPDSNYKLAQKMVEEHKWPPAFLSRISSETLIGKGFRTHYPSYLFLRGGNTSPVVPGYKTKTQLKDLAKDYL